MSDTLEPLLKQVREYLQQHPPTQQQRDEHAISFAWGNVYLHNPAITREQVAMEYYKARVDELTVLRATDQHVIAAIEALVADDFCEELAMQVAFHPERLTSVELTASEKLSAVYRLSHSFNRQHACYRVHDDWRAELAKETE